MTSLDVLQDVIKDGTNKVNFDIEGRGELSFVATLIGFTRGIDKTSEKKYVNLRRYYSPAPIVYDGKEIKRGFGVLIGNYKTWRSTMTQLPAGQRAQVEVDIDRRFDTSEGYLILEEHLPAGCTVLTKSIRRDFQHYELGDDMITFYLGAKRHYGDVNYDTYGYLPGAYRVLPSRVWSMDTASRAQHEKRVRSRRLEARRCVQR